MIEDKQKLYTEIRDRFSTLDTEVIIADSILIKDKDVITKIPMQRCKEEVYLLRKFEALGIPTVKILDTIDLQTQSAGKLSAYTMTVIPDSLDLIKTGNTYLDDRYYDFLKQIITGLRSCRVTGYGSVRIEGEDIIAEIENEALFFSNVLDRAAFRNNMPVDELNKLRQDVKLLKNEGRSVLVHTDILHNILVDTKKHNFYLIDPQTIISAANEYWDLSYYLIYANGFGCTKGLASFIKQIGVKDWEKFILTCRVNAFERATYYLKYEPKIAKGILKFWEHLKDKNLVVGEDILSQKDL